MKVPVDISATPRKKCRPESPWRIIAAIAARQWGLVSRRQLLAAGISDAAISRWLERGLLLRVLPGVYAVGHRPDGVESRLAAALLMAGDGAALSHSSATFWWRITDRPPERADILVPSARRSRTEVRFHRSRHRLDIVYLRDLPVVPPTEALFGYAQTATVSQLRRALAEADRLQLLDAGAIRARLGSGRVGSTRLREALGRHLPELASALSELERRFLELLADAGLPLPEVNVTVGGMMVDALYREAGLVIELDGHEFHANAPAAETDRQREMRLRALGLRIVRYTWRQVTTRPAEVLADLERQLAAQVPPAFTGSPPRPARPGR